MTDSLSVPLELARASQITRTGIVTLLHMEDAGERESIIKGCFVRVLLELENGNEDYRVGLVRSLERGASYNGFTNDPTVSTTLYLNLSLPGELSGINGSQFQLNSISNSQISDQELRDVNSGGWEITMDGLQEKAGVLSTHGVQSKPRAPRSSAPRQQPHHQSAPQQPPPQPEVAEPLGLTKRPPRGAAEQNEDEPSEDQLRRVVMEELREHNMVFPHHPESLKTTLLRTTERDMLEYLDQIRDTIRQNRSNCVVCMERPPTIISLPCKHQVLCRLCATQVKCCPACRETMVELFEPVEI